MADKQRVNPPEADKSPVGHTGLFLFQITDFRFQIVEGGFFYFRLQILDFKLWGGAFLFQITDFRYLGHKFQIVERGFLEVIPQKGIN